MSPSTTSCYPASVVGYQAHSPLHHTNPTYKINYVVDPRASPTLTTVTTYTRRRSPLPAVSPLPGSLSFVNLQSPHNHKSPNLALSALVLTTPQVHPLVAHGSGSRYHMVHYDISKDLSTARVPGLCGRSTLISYEQMHSLAVEGALHERFHIVFDHPVLASTIDFEGSPTVEDLLDALYSHFDKRAGSREMSNLMEDMYLFRNAVDTQVKRCEAAFDARTEWDRGMKRVDILGKGCKFHGIYLDSDTSISDYLTLRVVFGE